MDNLNEQILRAKELMGLITEQGKKYLVTGNKFCLMSTCILTIKVISLATGYLELAKKVDGKKTEEELYKELEDMLSKDSEWKELGVELIELKDFEDTAK